MKKLYILAALLMATTSAHAGGITLQINGERIRVESPRNCNGISCIKITAPGYTGTLGNVDLKGMGSKSKGDDDAVTTAPAAPPAPAPAQATAPQPPHPIRTLRSASGRRKRTRATFASRNAAPICAAIPSTRRPTRMASRC